MAPEDPRGSASGSELKESGLNRSKWLTLRSIAMERMLSE